MKRQHDIHKILDYMSVRFKDSKKETFMLYFYMDGSGEVVCSTPHGEHGEFYFKDVDDLMNQLSDSILTDVGVVI